MIVIDVAQKRPVKRVALAPDGASVVTQAGSSAAKLWEVATGRSVDWGPNTWFFNDAPAYFHPSGRWVVGTGYRAGGFLVHDLWTGRAHRDPHPEWIAIGPAAFAPDGGTVIYAGTPSGEPEHLFRATWLPDGTLEPVWHVRLAPDKPDVWVCTGLTVLPDGERFVCADVGAADRGRVTVRARTTGAVLAAGECPARGALELAVSPDGACVVGQSKNVLTLWTLNPDAPALRFERQIKHSELRHFTGVAFHPGGRYLAVTGNDETVKLFDVASWEVARTFAWNVGKLRCVCFSPDGTLAAAGSDSGRVVVWDVDF